MDALTKSLNELNGISNTALMHGLEAKAAGIAGQIAPQTGGFFGPGSDWAQQARNKESLATFHSWVYSAVHAIGLRAGSQPVNVGKVKGADAEEKGYLAGTKEESGKSTARPRKHKGTPANLMRKMTKPVRDKAAKQEVEVILESPLVKILERPNPLQHRFEFVYSFVANLNMTGKAYIVRDEENGQERYYSLPTTWVREDNTNWPDTKYYIRNPANPTSGQEEPLDASQVAVAYMPNPGDPMGSMAPAASQRPAIVIDEKIQACQENFFANSIFPTWGVIVGKQPVEGVQGGLRPMLSPGQRRQVEGAIMKVMGSVRNYGTPAILDGLIENIVRLSSTQNEIGWEKSEEVIRDRILSAFGVHPFIIGKEVSVGGYAQAAIIESVFCARVNVPLDMLGTVMTEFANQKGKDDKATGDSILVWWEAAAPEDPQLRSNEVRFLRQNGDITQNESRAEFGFPPDEDRNEAEISPTMAGVIASMTPAVAQGAMMPEQFQALLVGMGLSDELAEKIAGIGLERPEPVTPEVPAAPVPSAPEAASDEQPKTAESTEEDDGSNDSEPESGVFTRIPAGKALYKHLPGQHDQAEHGRGGSGGEDRNEESDTGSSTQHFSRGKDAVKEGDLSEGWNGVRKEMAEFIQTKTDPDTRMGLRVGGELVGAASVEFRKDSAYVALLATKRSGYGRQMMAEVCKQAANRGVGVKLEFERDAKGFYERIGMRQVGEWGMEFNANEAKRFADTYSKHMISAELKQATEELKKAMAALQTPVDVLAERIVGEVCQ